LKKKVRQGESGHSNLEGRITLCTKSPFIPKEKKFTTKKMFLETNKSYNYRNNHLKTKLKCFYMIKDFRTRIANDKKKSKRNETKGRLFLKKQTIIFMLSLTTTIKQRNV